MTDLLREIGQTMATNKLRTVLTGIAVTWGVFMLIVLLSMARGVTNSFEYNMLSKNTAVIRVWSGFTSLPYKGNREGRYIRLKESDMKIIPEKNSHLVKEVNSRIDGGSSISTPKAKVSSGYTGVFPAAFKEMNVGNMKEGRFINERDMRENAKVMVLPQYYAEQLFPPDGKGAYGGRVECNGLSFKVVGIFDSQWNRTCFIPFTTARMIAADRDDLGSMTVQLQNVHTEEDGTAAEKGIRETLAATHNFDPKDENAVWLGNSFNNSLKGMQAMTILQTSVWILGILTLLTGVVGISNIMFVTVRERTHEIGIRRAIGAKPYKILIQVITESVAITLVFGYIGIVLGTAVSQLIAHLAADTPVLRNPTVSIAIAIEVTVVLVLAGAIAGLFPALKALKVKPVEALRDE
jgi:putative ABC transport system permease protein